MALTLAIHPVTEIRFGGATRLEGTRLEVDREGLRRHLLEDRRLRDADIEVVRPGESCRIGVVFDIVEPRAKEPGSGSDFPGVLGPFDVAGQGVTHVLRGAAVTILDEGAEARNRVLEMSGPAAQASPYGTLLHLVVVPHAALDLERHAALNALRLASVKAAVYLARAALHQSPASTEVYDLEAPSAARRAGLPRVAYITQVYAHQRVVGADEQVLYGSNTAGMLPVPLHPNEWLDGAVVCANQSMQAETYLYQNHPVVLELYRRHRVGELTFAGTIATVAASLEDDRNRSCAVAANLAKWGLGADAVVLTKYGGGAPHADMGLTALLCERLGMRTAVQVMDLAGDRRAESALLFNYPEVNAIVYTGGQDTRWKVPAAERVIASNPTVAAALAAPQELAASSICGVTSQQGASRLRAFVY